MKEKIVSIRGAAVAQNTADDITRVSRRLIDRMYFKNGIVDVDVVNIIISSTPDITAFYPARAVRESGHAVPLFSCVEPSIDGAPTGCIRAMITAYSDNPVSNIYLGAARKLRKDLCDVYSIALDGPSGAGKSTVAKAVSKRLGITYLDTGALYRALGLKAVAEKVPTNDAAAVEKALENAEVSIEYRDGAQRVLLDGKDVSDKIRTPEISMAASAVSAIPFVRKKLLGIQRDIAKKSSVILDGRDIGTVVLPDSEFKFFLTASAEVRAKRRYDELCAKGENVSYEAVLKDVNARDRNDSTRAIAPLKKAYDATEIDSDGMTAAQVTDMIVATVTEVLE
ncbi:MAG: (d)CMP kinase [Roseburia sp.]|nr:(d)CMP kinase [Roseburia sp.]